ncbi:MAG: hypothetical protein P8Y64_13515 [Gammaproteobacteria bacterium]|jgi:thiosulfate/3-mercaptopyruvate sulfurtransferase
MDTLITTDWLGQHSDNPDLVVLDCTVYQESEYDAGLHNVSGRASYERAHIPNAGFADLKGDLCDTGSPIEFSVPTSERFCSAMGAEQPIPQIRWLSPPRIHPTNLTLEGKSRVPNQGQSR